MYFQNEYQTNLNGSCLLASKCLNVIWVSIKLPQEMIKRVKGSNNFDEEIQNLPRFQIHQSCVLFTSCLLCQARRTWFVLFCKEDMGFFVSADTQFSNTFSQHQPIDIISLIFVKTMAVWNSGFLAICGFSIFMLPISWFLQSHPI